ncbi:MAG: hypothetical protein AB8B83_04545, partial [Bdellovibrionales bacterium]
MPAPLVWAAFAIAAAYGSSTVAPYALSYVSDDYEFPDEESLHPDDAPEYTQRQLNPLWAPTVYLQTIDCNNTAFKARMLDGDIDTFREYEDMPADIQQAAEDTSLGYAVHVNEEGHAIISLKAMGKLVNNEVEGGIEGTLQDVFARDEQITVLDDVIRTLLDDPNINTIETVGFAQGSEGVYHLTENYHILGTNISNTGTDYTSEHLDRYVVWLDTPGDVHTGLGFTATGEHMPGIQIDLGEATEFSFVPVSTSFAEYTQTMAFQFDEAD